MLITTGGKNRNFNIKHKIILNYTWNSHPLVNVNVKRNDTSVDVHFSPNFAMAALRDSGPLLSDDGPFIVKPWGRIEWSRDWQCLLCS